MDEEVKEGLMTWQMSAPARLTWRPCVGFVSWLVGGVELARITPNTSCWLRNLKMLQMSIIKKTIKIILKSKAFNKYLLRKHSDMQIRFLVLLFYNLWESVNCLQN